MLKGEPDTSFPHPDWLMGEMNAHFTISTILNEYTKGDWRLFIDKRRKKMVQELEAEFGSADCRLAFGHDEALKGELEAMLGPLDDFAIGCLSAQMNVDVNLTHHELTADKLGWSDQQRHNGSLAIMRQFYELHGMTFGT